jgi:hypothetical protein
MQSNLGEMSEGGASTEHARGGPARARLYASRMELKVGEARMAFVAFSTSGFQ